MNVTTGPVLLKSRPSTASVPLTVTTPRSLVNVKASRSPSTRSAGRSAAGESSTSSSMMRLPASDSTSGACCRWKVRLTPSTSPTRRSTMARVAVAARGASALASANAMVPAAASSTA